jgi:K+ potassium transporter integral membrane domain
MTNGVDPEERVARREIDIAIGAFMGPARLGRAAARSSALLTRAPPTPPPTPSDRARSGARPTAPHLATTSGIRHPLANYLWISPTIPGQDNPHCLVQAKIARDARACWISQSRSGRSQSSRPVLPCNFGGALGVVFGDIGTSPITIQTAFNPNDPLPVPISTDNVYGLVSLIFWSVRSSSR